MIKIDTDTLYCSNITGTCYICQEVFTGACRFFSHRRVQIFKDKLSRFLLQQYPGGSASADGVGTAAACPRKRALFNKFPGYFL